MEQNTEVSYDVYRKPAKEGWVREVIYSQAIQNRVTTVYYLSPEDKNGKRKRLKTQKSVDAYIKNMGSSSTLFKHNFFFTRRLLGLGSDHEKTRIASQVAGRRSIFSSYYTHIVNSCPPTVTCNLCSKTMSYKNFSRHMTIDHLPDETCSRCNKEIPARSINKHLKTCSMTSSQVDLFLVSSTSGDEAFRIKETTTEASNEALQEEASVITECSEKMEKDECVVAGDVDTLRISKSAVPEVSCNWEKIEWVKVEVNDKLQNETSFVNEASGKMEKKGSVKIGASDTLQKEENVKKGACEWLSKEIYVGTEAKEKESRVVTGGSKKLKETVGIIIHSRRKQFYLQVNKHKQFKLAMKKVASRLSKNLSDLVFTVQGSSRTLTGREVMGTLEGVLVTVTECEESG